MCSSDLRWTSGRVLVCDGAFWSPPPSGRHQLRSPSTTAIRVGSSSCLDRARPAPSPLSPQTALDPTTSSTQDLPSPTGTVAGPPDPDALADEEAAGDGFFAATMAELGKVVWPSRQQLFSESLAVILMVSLSAAVIAAVGRFYGWLSGLVFR